MPINPHSAALLEARGIVLRIAHLASDGVLTRLPHRRSISLCSTLGAACRETAVHVLAARFDAIAGRPGVRMVRVRLFEAAPLFTLGAACDIARMCAWRAYSSTHQHQRWFRRHVTQRVASLPQVVTA